MTEYAAVMGAPVVQTRHLPPGKNVKLLYFHAFLVNYMKSSLMNKNKKKAKRKKKTFFFLAKK